MNRRRSSTGYSNASSGPISSSVRTWNGTGIGSDPAVTGTRQILPPYETTTSDESGVNDMPGSVSAPATDSWSSRWTG